MMISMARPKILDDAKRKMVSVPGALAEAIENYRFNNRLKTEAEAIRRLIEAGLQAEKIPLETGGSTLRTTKKPATSKRAPAPRAKALRMSKEAQIRALREQGA
jgi:hypothetical protein